MGDYLQLIYQGRAVADSARMRAAEAALPFERPKLAVRASLDAASFASRMEAVMERRGPRSVIDAPRKILDSD
jgi:hypothetical protein